MSIDDTQIIAEFERIGDVAVQMNLDNQRYNHLVSGIAIKWLAERVRERHLRDEASRSEELNIARSAKDAAFAANNLAAEANTIARDASASAARSADAARTNNTIAALALTAAIVAMAISIIGMFIHR